MLRMLTALLVLSLLVGCGREIGDRLPDDPDKLILYSLDPPPPRGDEEPPPAPVPGEVLYGYPVLGKVEVSDPARRREVIAAIKSAVRDKSAVQAKCFDPRHAIRVVKGNETIELVICFSCHNYDGYRQGVRVTKLTPSISGSAQPLIDQTLREAGVPLAAPPKQ
jgi:hypothetical protein